MPKGNVCDLGSTARPVENDIPPSVAAVALSRDDGQRRANVLTHMRVGVDGGFERPAPRLPQCLPPQRRHLVTHPRRDDADEAPVHKTPNYPVGQPQRDTQLTGDRALSHAPAGRDFF